MRRILSLLLLLALVGLLSPIWSCGPGRSMPMRWPGSPAMRREGS